MSAAGPDGVESSACPDGEEEGWCRTCDSRLPRWTLRVCTCCRRYIDPKWDACPITHENTALPGVLPVGGYDDGWGKLVRALKYDGARAIGPALGRVLALRVRELGPLDLVVPIPTTASKKRARGFGHAEVIAEHTARELGVACRADALTFTRAVDDQTRLSPDERVKNLDGALVASAENLADSRILIIDDVMTTGATVNEAARALRTAGAVYLYGAVVCLNMGSHP